LPLKPTQLKKLLKKLINNISHGRTKMHSQEKKVYTLEDNVKYISFGIKDLVKVLTEIRDILERR
jgi:hypothetical protein